MLNPRNPRKRESMKRIWFYFFISIFLTVLFNAAPARAGHPSVSKSTGDENRMDSSEDNDLNNEDEGDETYSKFKEDSDDTYEDDSADQEDSDHSKFKEDKDADDSDTDWQDEEKDEDG
jgi:hypothetical protein